MIGMEYRKYGSLGDWFLSAGIEPFECDEDVFSISAHSSKYHEFRCSRGHIFRQQPIHITEGIGCPWCSGSRRISKPEMCIYYAFRDKCRIELQHKLVAAPRKSIDLLFLDWRLGIEYDGQRWHKDPRRDIEKDRLAFAEGIDLIHIREPKCPDIPAPGYYSIPKPVNDWKDMIPVIDLIDEALGGGYCRKDVENVWNEVIRDLWNGKKMNSIAEWIYEHQDADEYEVLNGMPADAVYMSDNHKVLWKCRRCGEIYPCSPHNIKSSANGSRCPYCAGRKSNFTNSLSVLQPERAEYYSSFNDVPYFDLTEGSETKRIWVCEYGHYFEASPMHVFGKNETWCPICSNNIILPRFNDLETIDPYLAEFVRAGGGRPDVLAKNDKTMRLLKCPKCGHEWMDSIFKRRPRKMLCPVCKCRREDIFV